MIFRSFRSLWDISSETHDIRYGNVHAAKICPKHTCDQARVNMQNICTHLCADSRRHNYNQEANHHQKRNIYRDPPLVYMVVLAWAQQFLAVGIKPPLEDGKGLQALTALIGSIMKLHRKYLMVTTGDILFVRTEMVHVLQAGARECN